MERGHTNIQTIVWVNRNSHSLPVECKGVATLEDSLAVSDKAKHSLPNDLAIMCLDTCSSDLKVYVHTDPSMFIAPIHRGLNL